MTLSNLTAESRRLVATDWFTIGLGTAAALTLFLPWFSASLAEFSTSASGFHTGYGWVGPVVALGIGLLSLILKLSVENVNAVALGIFTVSLAAAGLIIVLVRWFTFESGSTGFGGGGSLSFGPRIGIWLAALACLAQFVSAGLGLLVLLGREPTGQRTVPTSQEGAS